MENLTHEHLLSKAKTDSKSIALIYSPNELYEYFVEIIYNNSDQFIRKHENVAHFHSIDEAIVNAEKHGAEEFYFCINNSYDEFGSTGTMQSFNYIPVCSKNKHK